MRNRDLFKEKNILIIGFARSGIAAAKLLHDLGANLWITDNQDTPALRASVSLLKSKDINIELGVHSRNFVEGKDLVVISPGVPDQSSPVIWAKEMKIPVISEIELSWRLCPAKVIAITGTNGKTTVTTLIGKVLQAAGKKVFTCGNIGKPFSSELEKMNEGDFVSLEISSFQLEYTDTFRPKISVILNLSRNHLDRYDSMNDYLAAKKRIFRNQDPVIRELGKESKARIVYFRKEEGLNPNQSAVLSVASILGIEKKFALGVFEQFKGVEHRMEEVLRLRGIKFVNDSKSTTTEATIWALNNLSGPAILICGGREKGNDYKPVAQLASGKVKRAILIGEAKDRIEEAFKGVVGTDIALSLEEAVKKAYGLAEEGDTVLFSPMCKSFDMFSNYEERGRIFKELVLELSKTKV
jgi:UDP-N-acetylmuramoylalanine--D-glutamate ligase